MSCGIFDLACHATGAWDGLISFLFGWLWAIPWGWLIAGLIVGAVLGAQFGWLAVISLGTSVLIGLAGPRVLTGAQPSPPTPSPAAPRQRKPFSRLRERLGGIK